MSTEIRAGQRYENERNHIWVQDVWNGTVFFIEYIKTEPGLLNCTSSVCCDAIDSFRHYQLEFCEMKLVHDPEQAAGERFQAVMMRDDLAEQPRSVAPLTVGDGVAPLTVGPVKLTPEEK